MSRAIVALAGLFFLVAGFGVAHAGIIFENGPPNQVSGNETTAWVQANDFFLASPGIVAAASFHTIEGYGTEFGGDPWDGTLDWFVFADASGVPGSSPLYSGAAAIVKKQYVGPGPFDMDEYRYEFNLPAPLTLTAGATYWLGLHLSSDFERYEIYWETADWNGSSAQASYGGTFDNWSSSGNEHTFKLYDERLPIPEPATLLLFGLGAGGLALHRRWSRRRR